MPNQEKVLKITYNPQSLIVILYNKGLLFLLVQLLEGSINGYYIWLWFMVIPSCKKYIVTINLIRITVFLLDGKVSLLRTARQLYRGVALVSFTSSINFKIIFNGFLTRFLEGGRHLGIPLLGKFLCRSKFLNKPICNLY